MFDSLRRKSLLAVCLCAATPAAAYVDPNIGGQIYQAIYPVLALLLGVLAFARHWATALITRVVQRARAILRR